MSATENGKSEAVPNAVEKPKSSTPKKRAKPEEKPAKVLATQLDDSDSEESYSPTHDGEESADFFNAVTKFSALKPGCYYKIVRLANYRNHRLVAVPVKGFEGTFKNFNNLVQQ